MSDELNRQWHDFARTAGGALAALRLALCHLGVASADAAAQESAWQAAHDLKVEARALGLAKLTALAGQVESLCCLMVVVGIELDEPTLFLLLEASGALQVAVESAVVFRRDATAATVDVLMARLAGHNDSLLLGGTVRVVGEC